MATDKTNNLTAFLTDLANTIRTKKGSTGLINPQNFSTEIEEITPHHCGYTLENTLNGNAGPNYTYIVCTQNTKGYHDSILATTVNPTHLGLIKATSLTKNGGTVSLLGGSYNTGYLSETVSPQDLGLNALEATTYMPTTTDQTISVGKFTTGVQTIKGDENLTAANIANGVTIFGVTGTHEGGITPTGNIELIQATSTNVTNYATATVKTGSATTPNTTIKATTSVSPIFTTDKGYQIGVEAIQLITPTITEGWISSGTAGNITVTSADNPTYIPQATWSITTETEGAEQLIYSTTYKMSAGYYPDDRYFVVPENKYDEGYNTGAAITKANYEITSVIVNTDGNIVGYNASQEVKYTGTTDNSYNNGHSAGYTTGYETGNEDGRNAAKWIYEIVTTTVDQNGNITGYNDNQEVKYTGTTENSYNAGRASVTIADLGYSLETYLDGSLSGTTYTVSTHVTKGAHISKLSKEVTPATLGLTEKTSLSKSGGVVTLASKSYTTSDLSTTVTISDLGYTNETGLNGGLTGTTYTVYTPQNQGAHTTMLTKEVTPATLGLTEKTALSKSGGTVSFDANSYTISDLSITVTPSDLDLSALAATTYTPTTTDQTIAVNKYTTGIQTIKGDANLIAANIAKNVTIFGVTGTYAGTSSNTAELYIDTGSAYVLDTNLTAGEIYCLSDIGLTYTMENGMYIEHDGKCFNLEFDYSDPTITMNTPTINTSTGLITATATVCDFIGHTTSDTKTLQLATKEATTVTPNRVTQIPVAANKYTIGNITVNPGLPLLSTGVSLTGTAATPYVWMRRTTNATAMVTRSSYASTSTTYNGATTLTSTAKSVGRVSLGSKATSVLVTDFVGNIIVSNVTSGELIYIGFSSASNSAPTSYQTISAPAATFMILFENSTTNYKYNLYTATIKGLSQTAIIDVSII